MTPACLTCHDPHDIPRGQEAVAHYTEVCQSCHKDVAHKVALPKTSTCLTCHMPKRRTDDVVHVVMTDHFIRRTQPQRDLLAKIAETHTPASSVQEVTLYYPVKLPPTPEAEISLAEAQVDDNGISRLQALLERYQPSARRSRTWSRTPTCAKATMPRWLTGREKRWRNVKIFAPPW